MNILFIYSLYNARLLNKPLESPEQIPFGISYISSVLKKHGHQTNLIVLSRIFGRENYKIIDNFIESFRPKLICFSVVFSEYKFIAGIANYIKNRYPDIYLLIGGVHASLNPEEVLLDDFDALCIGEGEYPALELVSQLEKDKFPSGIRNIWIKRGSGVERNPTRPFLEDLDSLPFPDREMWQGWIKEKPTARHAVLLGRGCPFECAYCCNHALRKISQGQYVRLRSPDNIVEEIKQIREKPSTHQEIYLEIETFYINKEWAIELCSKLEYLNKIPAKPISFGVNLRVTPNTNLEPLFMAFKKSNFKFVNIGLESGSEIIRQQILRRNYSNQDIINAVRLAREYGLKIVLYNLMGIPGETFADFKETIRINRICLPDNIFISIFFPYPGTDLYSTSKLQGLLDAPFETTGERCKAVLGLPGFNKKQIQKSYQWFYYDVYKGNKPLYKLLSSVFSAKFESRFGHNYILMSLYKKIIFGIIRCKKLLRSKA